MTEQKIAQIFEQVGLAKIVRELANDELMNAVQSAMIAIAQEQPSLPEGLEEASNDYARMGTKDGSPYISIEAKAAFRSGAEWMAGQGETLECLIDYKNGELAGINDKQSKKMLKDFCQKIGASRVIVQIRKKED